MGGDAVSLRHEQHRALFRTREFLTALMGTPQSRMRATEIRKQASACLKHFPPLHVNGKPMFSQDEFGDGVVTT